MKIKYKNRYLFLKRTYLNTIIIFKCNNNYITINEDKELLNYLNIKNYKELNNKHINYILIDNLEIKEHKIFYNNKYLLYYQKYRLNKLIKYAICSEKC